jgi:hypothetical protein
MSCFCTATKTGTILSTGSCGNGNINCLHKLKHPQTGTLAHTKKETMVARCIRGRLVYSWPDILAANLGFHPLCSTHLRSHADPFAQGLSRPRTRNLLAPHRGMRSVVGRMPYWSSTSKENQTRTEGNGMRGATTVRDPSPLFIETFRGSFSAVSKPNTATTAPWDSSWRALHLRCYSTSLKSQNICFFVKHFPKFYENQANFAEFSWHSCNFYKLKVF